MKAIPSSIVDGCMIVDFPYPSQEHFRATGTTTRLKVSKGSSNTWYDTITIDDILPIATELFRIAANNTHCYVFSDSKMLPIFIHLFTKAGFTYPTPPEYEHGNIIIFDHGEESNIIIWDKVSKGMGYHWRNQIEFIIMFEKGHRALNNKSQPNYMRYPMLKKTANFTPFPSQKPIQLYTTIIKNATKENQLCLDPSCGGGGNIIRACMELNRKFLAIELNKEYYNAANKIIARYQCQCHCHQDKRIVFCPGCFDNHHIPAMTIKESS